ncbi:hypothetical protein AKJ16_DCAP20276 [Drosera capensis]
MAETLLFCARSHHRVNPLILLSRSSRCQWSWSSLDSNRVWFVLNRRKRRRRMSKDSRSFFTAIEAAASSSAFPGGASAADVSGQFSGPKPKKKRQDAADELVNPKHLADPDSFFSEFKGVDVHYKVCDCELEAPSSLHEQSESPLPHERKRIGLAMILLHGFGASVFSWHKVMKPLASIIGSKVLAFDRPAFGLTSRVSCQERTDGSDAKSLNPYATLFSVLTTLHFIDLLGSDKAIIVGHSAGAFTAVRSYFEAPDRVAALILVAPAIIAPLSAPKVIESHDLPKSNQSQQQAPSSEKSPNVIVLVAQMLSMFFCNILWALKTIFSAIKDFTISVYNMIVFAILRSAAAAFVVRLLIKYFGVAAIRKSWYDESKLTDYTLQGYTKPLKAKGWDRALLEYIIALVADSGDESKPSQSRRVHEIKCPVLIVTGDTDRLVPAWNAERLSRAIPNSHFERMGHQRR